MTLERRRRDGEPIFDQREREHKIFSAEGARHLADELAETNAGEHHVSNLFDENETQLGGEKIDLATGKPIDNSTSNDLHGMQQVHAEELHHDAEVAGDPADEWLRQNDPNYKKKKMN